MSKWTPERLKKDRESWEAKNNSRTTNRTASTGTAAGTANTTDKWTPERIAKARESWEAKSSGQNAASPAAAARQNTGTGLGARVLAQMTGADSGHKLQLAVPQETGRTQAYPGDTITYQICIRNTGERTLHSVLSTERFQNAGIQANFVRKEGVTLNSTGTQALIPQIAPGEAFALYATVTVPQYMASQELINEVIVTSDETGTQAMTSKANVELKETDNIVTVTPQPASLASQSYGYDSKSGSAYTTASKPRTGDETETALYIVLGIFAIMSGVSAFCYRKTKKQQK